MSKRVSEHWNQSVVLAPFSDSSTQAKVKKKSCMPKCFFFKKPTDVVSLGTYKIRKYEDNKFHWMSWTWKCYKNNNVSILISCINRLWIYSHSKKLFKRKFLLSYCIYGLFCKFLLFFLPQKVIRYEGYEYFSFWIVDFCPRI